MPRPVQRLDGKIVTIYYFHDQPKGDRYIAPVPMLDAPEPASCFWFPTGAKGLKITV
jgi:hypothetical protein